MGSSDTTQKSGLLRDRAKSVREEADAFRERPPPKTAERAAMPVVEIKAKYVQQRIQQAQTIRERIAVDSSELIRPSDFK